MKFNFLGDIFEIEKGLEILAKRFNFEITDDGVPVEVIKREGNIEVSSKSDKIQIKYEKKIHFFRALSLVLENYGQDFSIEEKPVFNTNGIMIDASRNAVMKVENIKDFIEMMAVMGLNLIMMYTEDTYEVPEYPYFGYMRGRYTYDELHECDEYADIFGIEMIPCIQTLGHLGNTLKWGHGIDIKDTEHILLMESDDTYEFIRNMIKAATKPFKSNRIHIGMDEAYQLGTGSYKKRHGNKPRRELMKKHLEKVYKIIKELNLDAIMWADMFIVQYSEKSDYYDTDVKLPENIREDVYDDISYVYWDYYSSDQTVYEKIIDNHKKIGDKIIFAGGIWTWCRMNVNYRKTFDVTIPALRACKNQGITEVFATMWGDCGNETNIYEALYGMQLYAEMGYGYEPDKEYLNKRFKTCTGEDGKAFLDLGMIDELGYEPRFATAPNVSEALLWNDVLIGLLDKNISVENIAEYFKEKREMLAGYEKQSNRCKLIFEYAKNMMNVLEIKADLGIKLKKYYDEDNREALSDMVNVTLPELENRLSMFKDSYRKLWFSVYKPFGWEVIDGRIGCVISRVETAKFRISQYLNDEIQKIEELEEERLYYRLYGRPLIKDLSVPTDSLRGYTNVGM